MDEHMAAVLWTIAEEKKSLVSAAGPQNAGKSTVLFAALEYTPIGTPIHPMSGDIGEIRDFASAGRGGYLEVGEISDHRPERYIWHEPVQALFETLKTGYSLATTMHADGIEDVFHQICGINEIADDDASLVQYVVHMHRFGDDMDNYWRRVSGIWEIRGVKDGVPDAAELFTWREDEDDFLARQEPLLLGTTAETLAQRAIAIKRESGT
jgi:hypothetical protein